MKGIKLNVLDFLSKNVKPATGCTEPIAVGFATSVAYNALFNESVVSSGDVISFPKNAPTFNTNQLVEIKVKTDKDVFKNAYAVKIPGTGGQKGIGIATAMGLHSDYQKKLNLFNDITPELIEKAQQTLNSNKIKVSFMESKEKMPHLDIQVSIKYLIENSSRTSLVQIEDEHDNITRIEVDGKILFEGSRKLPQKEQGEFPKSIVELVHIAESMTPQEREEVYKGILMNKNIANEGLQGNFGLNIGKNLEKMAKMDGSYDSMVMQVRIMVAAAADARMGGAKIPVMSTSGSGNQGITALVPIAVISEIKNIDYDKTCKAALLSHLITKFTHLYSTHLSALCGCAVKAGIGATAGITYLLDGSLEEINNAINLVVANITGIICDGAKEGCALKLGTASAVATESALMALEGIKIPPDNGIIYENAGDTIKALGKISNSMVKTDNEIINLMQLKYKGT
ncbi:MAG: serine dehydratase subunit alpha family protein [Promethearchaeota archaeon]|nr:MAG: serine dehydratase subunit alpha family protein [Candidatus Lokiarchaeota archaeon]